jgi:small subunit ribosomal protein S3Ae
LPKKTRELYKEKRWYTVCAPALFGNCEIGETFGQGPDELKGRTMETTLREVTGDFTQQHVKLYFQISDAKGDKAYTKFIGHDLTRDYVRMHVRRGTTRVDAITDATTADGYKVRVRALAFTLQRVASSQSKAIRGAMTRVVRAAAERSNFSGFVHEMILGKLSADIHKQVKLIYPIKKIEIMKSKIIYAPPEAEQPQPIEVIQPEGKAAEAQPAEEAPSEEQPAEEEPAGGEAAEEAEAPAEEEEEAEEPEEGEQGEAQQGSAGSEG